MATTLPLGLPRFAALKYRNNNRFMRYTHEDTQQHGLLQLTATLPDSAYVKYEFEPAKIPGGFVHIKSSYNHKYLRRWNNSTNWIGAFADEPEEDRTKWSCTLFQPSSAGTVVNVANTGSNLLIRFRHVQLNLNLTLFTGAAPYNQFVHASWTSLSNDQFEVFDWGSLALLPETVALKGDNGRYLAAEWDGNRDYYMSFSSNDLFGSRVPLRPTINPNGSLFIRTHVVYPGWHYMRRAPNSQWLTWGRPGTGGIGNDRNYVFWAERLEGNNKLVLRNLGNNLYCRRNTRLVKRHRMEASERNTPWETHLEVEERVQSRRIHDLDFRLQDARIYNQTARSMARNTVENNSPNIMTTWMRLKYEDRWSRNWQSTVSVTFGVKTTLTTGIPTIKEASVEVSLETTTEYTWGETHEKNDEVEVGYIVRVSPRSRMVSTMLGTEGVCDVPFSYTQTDTLRDGTTVSLRKHDGIFTGVNSYDFTYVNNEEKL